DIRRTTLHRIIHWPGIRRSIGIIIIKIIDPTPRRTHTLLRNIETWQRRAPHGAGRGQLIPATQILTGSHIIDAQLRRQRRGAHTEDDSEVDGLGLSPGATQTLHDQVVIIPTVLESRDHLGVARERREDAQLELGIVNIDESATLGSMEEVTEFRIGWNVLQIRIGTGIAPGDRPTSVQLTVQPPVDNMAGERRAERRQ